VSPAFIGLSYLLNPFCIASCLAGSLQNVHHLWFCLAVCCAGKGHRVASAFSLAVSLYVCPYTPIVLLLPCAYLSFVEGTGDESAKGRQLQRGFALHFLQFTLSVGLVLGLLVGVSFFVMGWSWDFVQACCVAVLTVQDLTPNVGMFWYIFILMFERYKWLFVLAFHSHLLGYPLPIHMSIGRHAPVGRWIQCSAAVCFITIFKPYPTSSDYGLMLSVMLLSTELVKETEKYFAFLMGGILFGLSMFPTMSSVWLTRNAGNANYLYNMTLVVSVFSSLLLGEWLKAAVTLRKRQRLGEFLSKTLVGELDAALSDTQRRKAETAAKEKSM